MPRRENANLSPIAPEDFGAPQAAALLRRAGFGGAPEQAETLASFGPERAVDLLVNYAQIADPSPPSPGAFDAELMREYTEAERQAITQARLRRDENTLAKLRLEREQMERRDRAQIIDVQRWWLERMIESPRPLEEKMTLFWHGHFATSQRKVENSYHLFLQNLTFRAHATGSFADLLRAMVRDPAMLAWLDNHTSRAEAPNENLAREIMELFALGPGAYTEKDIKEGARALTGHTFQGNEFVFRADWHDNNLKTILGARGRFGADDFVDQILRQRACADFLALKVYRFFVDADAPESPDLLRDAPPSTRDAIETIANDLRRSKYTLKPALTRLFLSKHFHESCARSTHIKSPVELVVGSIRTMRTPTRNLGVLLDALARMGQEILFPPTVAGWTGGRAWINTATLLTRQNTLVYLLTGVTPQAARDGVLPGLHPEDARDYDALGALPFLRDARTPLELASHACVNLLANGADASGAIERLARWSVDRFECGSPVAPLPRRLSQDDAVALLIALSALPEHQLC
jgi:uncharacterized protein (DUF1800 family)